MTPAPGHAGETAPERYPALDGLRGAAALMVFLSHASLAGIPLVPGADFSGVGKYGVYLFFVLSAFLLTGKALAQGATAYHASALRRYAWRRVLRIYPAFAAYLLFALAATAALGLLRESPRVSPFPLDPTGFLAHLALLRGEGVTWSIAVEFKYYLVLPAVAWLLWRAGRLGAGALAAASAALLAAAALAGALRPTAVNDMGLAPYLTLFIAGAVLAAWRARIATIGPRAADALGWAGLAGAVLLMPSINGWLFGAAVESDRFHGQHALFAALWCAVLVGVVSGRSVAAPFLGRPARFLGAISFSFYLWHVVAISLAKAAAGVLGALAGPVALAGAVGLAWASHRWIEQAPDRLAGRPSAGPAPRVRPAEL